MKPKEVPIPVVDNGQKMSASGPKADIGDRDQGEETAAKDPGFSRWVHNRLFGYDYFLAHRSADGKAYASALYDKLTAKGNELDCFLDVKNYEAGGSLKKMQARALGKTTRLIVIVTPGAHDEVSFLRKELKHFKKLHPEGNIVPIGTQADTLCEEKRTASWVFKELPNLNDKICVYEEAPPSGEYTKWTPSDRTVAKLLNDFSEERRSTKRLRWIRRFAVVMVLVSLAAVWFARDAYRQKGFALQQKGIALQQKDYALQQKNIAETQTREARHNASQANVLLARSSEEKGNTPEALAYLAESLRLNPQNSEAVSLTTTLLLQKSFHIPGGDNIQHAEVSSAEFSPDGLRVITTSDASTVKIWNAATGRSLDEPINVGLAVRSLVGLSPDGRRRITANPDGTAELRDVTTGKRIGEPIRHGASINSVQFSPDSQRVVTGSLDRTARLWDANTGKSIGKPMLHGGNVEWVQFSPDGQRVATASLDTTARLWDATTGAPLGEPMYHGAIVRSAQFSPDARRLVTASDDSTARLWDATTGKPLSEPITHGADLRSARFSADGERIVTEGKDSHDVRVWDASTGKPIARPIQNEDHPGSAAFSPDGQREIRRSAANTVGIWDIASGRQVGESMNHDSRVLIAQFSPDGQRVVTATNYGDVFLWQAATGKQIGKPMKHRGPVYSTQFSRDGQRLLTASFDHTARLWSAATGQLIGEPMAHKGSVMSAQWSPDGQRVVTASRDRTARFWDAATGRPIGEPIKQESEVLEARFSPDGQRAVILSGDGSARIWDSPAATSQDTAKNIPLLVELAEAIGGVALVNSGEAPSIKTLLPGEVLKKRRAIAAQLADPSSRVTPLQRFLYWCVTDSKNRTISPFSRLTFAEWIDIRIKRGDIAGLREAMHMDPGNPHLTAHLGRRLADLALTPAEEAETMENGGHAEIDNARKHTDPAEAFRARGEAAFLADFALKLAPQDEEVQKLREETIKLLQSKSQNRAPSRQTTNSKIRRANDDNQP